MSCKSYRQLIYYFIFYFFFSSRRRHTRLTCDWSSDVCSSDLLSIPGSVGSFSGGSSANYKIDGVNGSGSAPAVPGCTPNSSTQVPAVGVSNGTSATVVDGGTRSEERRVGKEGRSRRWAYQYKETTCTA